MDTIKYEVLLDTIKSGSVTATAERMGYTQSGLSHMLNNLENEIGLKLIIRDRNGVKLTSAGETLVPYLEKVVYENECFNQAVSEVLKLTRGCITIGSMDTISTFYLPEVIKKFREKYPHIEFKLKNGSYQENEKWLINKEVDCGFILLPSPIPFNIIPVINDRFVIVAGKEYHPKFSNPNEVEEAELLKEQLISVDGIDDFDLARIFLSDVNKLKIIVTTKNTYAAIKMLKENLGVCVLPYYLAEEFSDVLNIYEFKNSYERTLALAYGDKQSLSPITKKFIEFVNNPTDNIIKKPDV